VDVGENEMIPESIKIDDNGDFEITSEKYNGYGYEEHVINFTFEEIEEAYLLARSKKYPEKVKYGCYLMHDEHKGKIFQDCLFDSDLTLCGMAINLHKEGKYKKDCRYWHPVEVKK
jgi:hypothetical protein